MYDCVCIGMCECGRTHTMAHVEVRGQPWVSIFSFGLLWGRVAHLLFTVALSGASLVFPPLPSRGTLGTQTVPLHLLLCGFWGLNAVQEVWVAKSLSAEAFPQPPQASFDNIIYLPGFWLSPCTLFSSTFSPQTTLSVWSPALGVPYSRPDRWWHIVTNLWREMVKPVWQIQKLRLTK